MNLTKSKIFLILCLGFIVGIAIGRFISYQIMAVCAMIFIIVATVNWPNRIAAVVGIAGLVLLLGAVRFKTNFAQNDLAAYYNQKAEVIGVISEEPDERSDKVYLTLGDLEINGAKKQSKILLTVNLYPKYEYGQKLKFTAKITEPKEYTDFSYKNYLSRFGIDAVVYLPKIEVVDGQFGNSIKLGILRLKQKFVKALGNVLPEPQNAFLGGLLLGAKRQIPKELSDQFSKTGTSHIVAISGYNITIIAGGIEWLLAWFGVRKRISFGIAIIAIVGFVVMTGASASAVRAGIMGILLLLSLNVGRVSVAANALAFTAVVMLLINPQILAFDVGFQLSFAALIGIIYLVPLIEPYFLWLPNFLSARQYFLATLAAQIFTLPILVYNFGQLSLVSLLPNILVLPTVPAAMLFGFITGLMAMIWAKLAYWAAGITWLILTYILKVIGFFAHLSFASVSIHVNFWWVVCYYLLLSLIFVKLSRQKEADALALAKHENEF